MEQKQKVAKIRDWLAAATGFSVGSREDPHKDTVVFRLDGPGPRWRPELEIPEDVIDDYDVARLLTALEDQEVPRRLQSNGSMRLSLLPDLRVPLYETRRVSSEGQEYELRRYEDATVEAFDNAGGRLPRMPQRHPIMDGSLHAASLALLLENVKTWSARPG